MDSVFIWLESTSFSTWMRESPSVFAFPIILSCHTVGMGLVAGVNGTLALRILGVGRAIPIRELRRFFPVMWFGFWLNAASGVALLIAYPTKALTNPVFYLKLSLIAIAVGLVGPISRRVFQASNPTVLVGVGAVGKTGPTHMDPVSMPEPASSMPKALAVASLLCWAGAITSGRFLAYTYTRLMANF